MRTPRRRTIHPSDLLAIREAHRSLLAVCARLYPAGDHYRAVCRAAEAIRQSAVECTGDPYAFATCDGAGRAPGPAEIMLAKAKREDQA